MERGPVELYRCLNCHRLIHSRMIHCKGQCACGGRRVCGTSPVGILEKLQVFWWELIVR